MKKPTQTDNVSGASNSTVGSGGWVCPWGICNQEQAQECIAEMHPRKGCGGRFPRGTTLKQAKQMIATQNGLVRPPIQDVGPSRTDKLCVPVYHTHGFRQYVGTCKVHVDVDCRHLRAWKPAPKLAKMIMREWEESLDAVPASWRCKTCWPNLK